MGHIRLFTINTNLQGTQFILKDYPDLQLFDQYAKRKEIKRLNIEDYFRGINKDYKDYIKIMYGPVYGVDDPRNGFVYEHSKSGELLMVDENDIPVTYEACDIIMATLDGIVQTDTNGIQAKKVITEHGEMISIAGKTSNPTLYNELIRDEWIINKSFLTIN